MDLNDAYFPQPTQPTPPNLDNLGTLQFFIPSRWQHMRHRNVMHHWLHPWAPLRYGDYGMVTEMSDDMRVSI